jgi:UDP-N-acetylmuramyl pentapeptide synthase
VTARLRRAAGAVVWTLHPLRSGPGGLGARAARVRARARALLLPALAARWRSALPLLQPVAVTGSCGKTTAKALAASVLAARGGVPQSPANDSSPVVTAKVVLRSRPWTRACVVEMAVWRPGCLDASLRLLRPRVAVVTALGADHASRFRGGSVAAEKVKVVAALPPTGTAVLNADDPDVLAMAARCAGRVLTFGRSEGAELRATDVRADWPERLSFTACWRGERVRVGTRLLGEQLLPSVLGALGAGLALGVPLPEAARRVAAVEPRRGRMQPVVLPEGITFVRDDWKAPFWTMPSALDFLARARASRRVAVLGTISDTSAKASRTYPRLARLALAAADHVVFVGPNARLALRARRETDRPDAIQAFATAREASGHLARHLRSGDLVLLKGSNPADHLERLVLARQRPVACWRTRCGRKSFCSRCELLDVPEGPDAPVHLRLASPDEPAAAAPEAADGAR